MFLVLKILKVLYIIAQKKSHCEIKSSWKKTNNQERKLYCTISFHEVKGLGFYKCSSKDKKSLIFKSALWKESQIFRSSYAANKQALGSITYALKSRQDYSNINKIYKLNNTAISISFRHFL